MSQIQLKEPSFDMCGSSKPYDDCNSWRWKGCNLHSGKAYVKSYRRNCMRLKCRVCKDRICSVKAHQAQKRIDAYKIKKLKPKHVIVSPPPDLEYEVDYEVIRKKAINSLRLVNKSYKNSFGGIMIVHPRRCESIRDYEKVGLHFHFIGFINVDYKKVGEYSKTKKIYIVKDLGIRKSVFKTVRYAYDHAGVYKETAKKKYKTASWIGCLSINYKFTNGKKLYVEPDPIESCPKCPVDENGFPSLLFSLEYVGDNEPLPDLEGSYYKSDNWIYPTKYHNKCLCC